LGNCRVENGKYAVLIKGQQVRVSEETHNLSNCNLEAGSVIRIYRQAPTEEGADLLVPRTPKRKKSPVMETKEVQAPKPVVVQAKESVVEVPSVEEAASEDELTEQVLIPSEVEQAVATAQQLGGDYAPMVAIALAGIAVLGGKKAWSFYSERAEQRHEIQMKKLEMEQSSSNEDGQSPPACQAVHASLKAEVSAMQTKLGLVEKKLLFVDDFDPEDLERRVKKLSKNVKALQEEIE